MQSIQRLIGSWRPRMKTDQDQRTPLSPFSLPSSLTCLILSLHSSLFTPHLLTSSPPHLLTSSSHYPPIPHLRPSFPSHTVLRDFQAFVNTIKSFVGVGILEFPYAVKHSGLWVWFISSFLIFFFLIVFLFLPTFLPSFLPSFLFIGGSRLAFSHWNNKVCLH